MKLFITFKYFPSLSIIFLFEKITSDGPIYKIFNFATNDLISFLCFVISTPYKHFRASTAFYQLLRVESGGLQTYPTGESEI